MFRNVRQWRQRNKNQKTADDEVPPSEPVEAKEENTSDKENENTNSNVNGDVEKTENKDSEEREKDAEKEVTNEGKDDEQDNSQDSVIPKPPDDIDIIDNTECKFNVNSFKLVYVVNSESYLYKRMALQRAREVSFGTQYQPRCEKTGLRGFRPGPTQSGLYSLRR